ncbi:hypothetical protein G4228_006417 [Cervus hanglu yarkandensis]|nr:hypothetical protein G4228_006417 [Cervus hanglu yarkandensis]
MSSLSILHLLLLLLALHAPQAKGLPVTTSRPRYSALMKEIMNDLEKITTTPTDSLSSDEKNFLTKESLLQKNLKVFMTFATDTFGNDSKIMKNLKENPIFIEKNKLGDFRMKLEEYLAIIRNYLKSKNLWFP